MVIRHIHAPLGSTNVGYFLSGFATTVPPALAYPSPYQNNGYLTCEHFSVLDYPTTNFRTSAIDLAKFMSMFVNGGTYKGTQILKPETVANMKTRSGKGDECEESTNGIWLFQKGTMDGYLNDWILGHDGDDVGTATQVGFNPVTGVGFVFLTNANGDGNAGYGPALKNILGRLMSKFDTEHTPSTGGSCAGGGGGDDDDDDSDRRRLKANKMEAPCTPSSSASVVVASGTGAGWGAAALLLVSDLLLKRH